jgi:hypothetical protein
MASNATTPRPGRVVRMVHHLLPSRWQVALLLFTEVVLTIFGAPLWLHIVAAGLDRVLFRPFGRSFDRHSRQR